MSDTAKFVFGFVTFLLLAGAVTVTALEVHWMRLHTHDGEKHH